MQNAVWKALTGLSAVAAAMAARKGATSVWSKLSDTEPPVNPADRSVSWKEAAGWAVLAGVAAGVARVVARRISAQVWEKATGETPPGIQAA